MVAETCWLSITSWLIREGFGMDREREVVQMHDKICLKMNYSAKAGLDKGPKLYVYNRLCKGSHHQEVYSLQHDF